MSYFWLFLELDQKILFLIGMEFDLKDFYSLKGVEVLRRVFLLGFKMK